MVCNLLKKIASRLFRRPSVPPTVLPVYTQGSTACKRGFATVIDTNKLHHITNYGTLNNNNLVNGLYHYDSLCWRCGQMIDVRFPLSSPSTNNKDTCLGCCRLFGPYKDLKTQLEIISKLLNCNIEPSYLPTTYGLKDLSFHGKHEIHSSLSIQDPNYHFGDDRGGYEQCIIQRSIRAHRFMETRIQKQNTEVRLKETRLRELATSLELFDLMRKSNSLCAVSGVPGIWTRSLNKRLPPPFFLTFDHIDPISQGGTCNIQNIQILSYCLNQVKGSESNTELIRWLTCFQNGMRKRMIAHGGINFCLTGV